jgi:hypothetical protein
MSLRSITVAATAAILATVSLALSAEAGGCGGGYGKSYSSRTSYSTPSHAYAAKLRARRAAEARAVAAAKHRKAVELAEARDAAKARKLVAAVEVKSEVQKDQAPVSAVEPTTAKDATPVAIAATPATCRKFIPATGTTAEVPCSIE